MREQTRRSSMRARSALNAAGELSDRSLKNFVATKHLSLPPLSSRNCSEALKPQLLWCVRNCTSAGASLLLSR